ncbi:MAG: NAD(+)/NADH kinase [Chloroflexota bacterium]
MKKIALFENTDSAEAIHWAQEAARALISHDTEIFARPELVESFSPDLRASVHAVHPFEFDKYVDVVISFGGDGTMLSIARLLISTGIPIMGVNVGKLGFLAEFSTKNIEKAMKDLLDGNYRVVDRAALQTTLNGATHYALNDFVIEKKGSSRMITVQAYANDHYIGDYRADGLIVTTPTGATAYSLSCGGPLIAPSTSVLCITPVAPHTLTLRPLVVPDTAEIKLKVYSPTGEVILVADGQTESTLNNLDSIIIKIAPYRIKLIKPQTSSYYDLLRTKLLWAANSFDKKPCENDDTAQ